MAKKSKRPDRGDTEPSWEEPLLTTLARSRQGSEDEGKKPAKDGSVTQRVSTTDIEGWLVEILGVERSIAREIWRVLTARVRQSLLDGKAVVLSRIGTVEPYTKKGTKYRHPTTGALEDIPPKTHLRLVVSQSFKLDANEKPKPARRMSKGKKRPVRRASRKKSKKKRAKAG